MKVIDENDPRIVFMPEDQVLAASGLCNVLRNRYFLVHPEKGLIFWQTEKRRHGQIKGASPQCNSSRTVVEYIKKMYPWAEIKKYDLILLPININDYVG